MHPLTNEITKFISPDKIRVTRYDPLVRTPFFRSVKVPDEIRNLEASELEIVLNPKIKHYNQENRVYPKGRSKMGLPGTSAQKGKKKWKKI